MSCELSIEKEFILFVGEGDFSFAASYLKINREIHNEEVFATCLSYGEINSKQKSNIMFIEQNGGIVLTDVDATSLENHVVLKRYKFSSITFNFPHIPKKMNIRDNRKLVQLFLKSAEKILKANGRICVSLCRGQGGTDAEIVKRNWCDTWQIVSLAANAGLILCDIKPFKPSDFCTYECTGYRGLPKSFDTEGAITHVFCRGETLVYKNYEIIQNMDEVDKFITDLKEIYKFQCMTDSPRTRIMSILDSALTEYHSIEYILVPEVLICKNSFSSLSQDFHFSEEEMNCERSTYCNECLCNIASLFLKNEKNDSNVTLSVISSISCFINFNVSKPPFFHLLSYFDSCEESIMTILNYVFKLLKESHLQGSIPNFTWSDIGTNLKSVIFQQKYEFLPLEIESIKIASYIYAICSVKKSNCCIFYTNINIITSNERILKSGSSYKYFEIGCILHFSYNMKCYTGALLNLDIVSRIKFHIMDYRLLFLKEAYFTTQLYEGIPMQIFRSPSLFPSCYVHDVSFWVNEKFQEKYFFIIIKNTVGCLVKNVKLVDSYYNNSLKKASRCYRFVYQSCNKVLSKQSILEIHTRLVRHVIKHSLDVCLR